MADLLPVGTYVRVAPFPVEDRLPYTAVVRGYDMFGTKYKLGYEFLPGQFTQGGWWAFPSQVEVVDAGQ